MSFVESTKIMLSEDEGRKDKHKKILSFGIDFLDDAMMGILPDDLVLIGAPSGLGKTQLCCNIALNNTRKGKRVHYIALEASYGEIERRIKYQIFAKKFFEDPNRPKISISYQQWKVGLFLESCEKYEAEALREALETVDGLKTFYKQGKYGIDEFIESILLCADETDLIIVDHVHYFDYDDENENRAIKKIIMMARDLVIEQQKPIVLISHLRKSDKFAQELCPGMEEFHGSSDLFKVSTKAVTMGPGSWNPESGKCETLFRVVKNRDEGVVIRSMGSCNFLSKDNSYEEGYRLGYAHQKRDTGFTEMDGALLPAWAKRARSGGILGNVSRQPPVQVHKGRPKPFKNYVDTDAD